MANRENPQNARVLDSLSAVPVESVVLIEGSVRLRPQKAQRKTASLLLQMCLVNSVTRAIRRHLLRTIDADCDQYRNRMPSSGAQIAFKSLDWVEPS